MSQDAIDRIRTHPDYQRLVTRRRRLGWRLTVLMLVIYYGFILAVAFAPEKLGAALPGMTMTVGIPLGLLVIISAFILTAIYVARANREFDQLTRNIVEDVK
ncbi:DUF485 domain-containing protein [Govanella unica]|uniref:DUF485 domain-containing protein n=1 Tax=Govanella unica TaxID=2975056 RepID=A0A9X3TXS2_9PROT|nr:DUF485 domain-containing protein [Govania unica]MDA5193721.1 DUF485 domain-containing protein [Govania unica]